MADRPVWQLTGSLENQMRSQAGSVARSEGSSTSFTTLAFHAEKLHQNRVWRQVEKAAHGLAQHGVCATFFVYPSGLRGLPLRWRFDLLAKGEIPNGECASTVRE